MNDDEKTASYWTTAAQRLNGDLLSAALTVSTDALMLCSALKTVISTDTVYNAQHQASHVFIII